MAATAVSTETSTGGFPATPNGTFDAFFDELRTDLGEDNFRNFLVALSGRKPKEGLKKKDWNMGKFMTGWWFQIFFFIFNPIWGTFPF